MQWIENNRPCNHLFMSALLIAGQLITLLAIVAVSAWGRRKIDEQSRIPARAETTGFDWTMSKTTALLYTPLIGSLVVIGTLLVRDSRSSQTIAALGLAILVVFLLAHWSSVRRAAR